MGIKILNFGNPIIIEYLKYKIRNIGINLNNTLIRCYSINSLVDNKLSTKSILNHDLALAQHWLLRYQNSKIMGVKFSQMEIIKMGNATLGQFNFQMASI